MLEINKFPVADITAEQFTTLMQSRPLHFKFIVNPMRIALATMGKGVDDASEDESEAGEGSDAGSASAESEYCDINRDNDDEERDNDSNGDDKRDDDDCDGDDEGIGERQARSIKTLTAKEVVQPLAFASSVEPKPAAAECKSGHASVERRRLDGDHEGKAEAAADEKAGESTANDSDRNSAESQARNNTVADANEALVPGTSLDAAPKADAAVACGYGQADAMPLAPSDIASSEKSLDENECNDSSRRKSVSDWYSEETPTEHKGKRNSLSDWYSDGAEIDRATRLTMRYRMSVNAESFTPEQQATSELATALDAAMRSDNIEELISVIGKAQAAGVMADVLDSASCRLAELQGMLERSATVASF
eukprot:TRINITY_DN27176_c0_g1_i1.p1 TRINITY_DN27176_c0_g1~~TRINITY_DN27176_c0_g1_i1.p1  ORF type:complete len:366 (-),score=86.85 TRINITY_DN27176_c0_g1_i1:36-1133(-)